MKVSDTEIFQKALPFLIRNMSGGASREEFLGPVFFVQDFFRVKFK